MVEADSSSDLHARPSNGLVLNSLETLPEMVTPSLCEIWNWQGDTSVLPYKFESVLNACSTDPELYNHTALKQ